MKKLVSLLLALVMCASLAACGGPDKQPAVDAYNKAADAVNAVADILYADPETYAPYIEDMLKLIDTMNECGEKLKGDDLSQEQLDKIAKDCGEIEEWAIAAKAAVEG